MNGYNSITYAGEYDDYLEHHGIKGQHWGERRFQDEQGRWTAAGRERYGKGGGAKGVTLSYVREHSDYKDAGLHLSNIPKSPLTKKYISERSSAVVKSKALAGAGVGTALYSIAVGVGAVSTPISAIPASVASGVGFATALSEFVGSKVLSSSAKRLEEQIDASRESDKREYIAAEKERLAEKQRAKEEAQAAKKQAKLDAKEQKKRDKWLQKFEKEDYEYGGRLVSNEDREKLHKMHADGASIEELDNYLNKAADEQYERFRSTYSSTSGHGVKGMSPEQRMRTIRAMEKMERSGNTERSSDGSMVYKDRDGNPLMSAKMVRQEGHGVKGARLSDAEKSREVSRTVEMYKQALKNGDTSSAESLRSRAMLMGNTWDIDGVMDKLYDAAMDVKRNR